MYNPHYDRVLAYVHKMGHDRAGAWFTSGDCARATKMAIPTARKYLRQIAGQYENLIDVTHEEYRSNVSVQLFRVHEVK